MNRKKIKHFIESRFLQNFIITLIILNSITIGFETSEIIMSSIGNTLLFIDKIKVFVLQSFVTSPGNKKMI